jgi:hypothetical protein
MFKWIGQIRAALKIKSEVQKMKLSEIKTSEGRMTLLTNILGIWAAAHGFIPAPLMAKITVASVGIYAISRALVKLGETIAKITPSTKDDEIVAEAGAILDKIEGGVK